MFHFSRHEDIFL